MCLYTYITYRRCCVFEIYVYQRFDLICGKSDRYVVIKRRKVTPRNVIILSLEHYVFRFFLFVFEVKSNKTYSKHCIFYRLFSNNHSNTFCKRLLGTTTTTKCVVKEKKHWDNTAVDNIIILLTIIHVLHNANNVSFITVFDNYNYTSYLYSHVACYGT